MFKLSVINAKKSFKDYSIYIITVALCIAFLCTIFTVSQDEQINNPRLRNMETFKALFSCAKVAVIFVLFWFIRYMGKYIFNLRLKEFASYMLLGVENKNINLLYGIEQAMLGLFSCALGLVLGSLLYTVLPKIVMSFLDLEYKTTLFLPVSEVVKTVLVVFCIYAFYIFKGSLKFKHIKIIDLLKQAAENEKIKVKRFTMPLFVFLFLLLASYAYILHGVTKENPGNLYTLSFFGMLIGLFGIAYFFPAFIFKLKTRGSNSYEQKNLAAIFSNSKLASFAAKLGLITLLALVGLVAFNMGFMSVGFYNLDREGKVLYDLTLLHAQDSPDSKDVVDFDKGVSALLDAKIGIVSEAVISEYYDTHTEIWYAFTGEESPIPQRVTSLSVYNQVRRMHGMDAVSLEPEQFILNVDMLTYDEKPHLEDKSYPIFDKLYRPKEVIVLPIRAMDSRLCIVVADSEIPNVIPKQRKHFWNLKPSDSEDALQNTLVEICRELGRPVHRIEKNGRIIEVPDKEFTTRYQSIRQYKVTAAAFIMVSFYIGIILLTATGSVLASSAMAEAGINTYRCGVLSKLGMEQKDIGTLIKKQIYFFFVFPVSLALPAGIGINMLIINNTYYYGNYYVFIAQTLVPQVVLYLAVFFLYYLMTYKLYKNMVKPFIR
ncbi:ABC transporter permease [Treponema sp. OMZ 787]|uniref:FtsX-like permease family protein n=1 Tax=Treponema sp. OMZ 787 TaxID=2563669 RepID=UPI0020A27040|nr:ABC transporter permease [Treponema sp. OMZ 787]UTC61672.1 ABC transporter permease [Treponema sp. OMZ 787]